MITELNRRRILEYQKQKCRRNIDFHAKNVALQSIVSLLCVVGGTYAGQRRSIMAPLVLAPMAAVSCSKLATHETKRRRYKEILKSLERN